MMQEKTSKILIIDDDPTLHLWAERHLANTGLQLISALNGNEGILAFKQHLPDITLVDIVMPELDGFTTCRALRKIQSAQNLPILVITGTEEPEKIAEAYASGATDFVLKPINWQVLIHRLLYMLKASNVLIQLEQSEARLSQTQQLAKLGHWEWNPLDNSMRWSQELYSIFRKNASQFMPNYESFLLLIHEEDRRKVEQALQTQLMHQVPNSIEYRIITPDNSMHWVNHQLEVVTDAQDRVITIMGAIQDISEQKRIEHQVRHLAYYDEITNLPNRAYFFELLSHTLELAKRHKQIFAILFLDLDGFKAVNDSYGHSTGDALLKAIADRLSKNLRSSDITSRHVNPSNYHTDIARMGGDEFTVLINDLHDDSGALIVAENILQWLVEPLEINGLMFYTHASIGIALFPQDGQEGETLLKNADIAMYHAKKMGKGNYQFYDSAMKGKVKKRMEMETFMHQALANNELCLHYQPVVNAETGDLIGAEALMRWNSPQLGFLAPGQFIDIAEENGMIIPYGTWAIREACRQHQLWRNQGLGDLSIAVNISSIQFAQVNFITLVKQAIADYQMDPSLLVFELTESIIMADDTQILDSLCALKSLGIQLSIDDFGTGYSSLSYLKRFPLDSLKIDRSFIQDLPTNPEDVAIVNAIMALANTLNLKTIAEGVETPEQYAFLQANTCHEIQGYLFAKPMPIDDFYVYWANLANRRS